MNDSDWKPKKLPPDDFSKTTPNIRIPREDLPPPREDFSNDWEKTNYNYSPKQSPPVDDWGRPASNNVPRSQPNNDWGKTIAPGQKANDDWGKTFTPGRQPRENDWGATQANINIPNNSGQEDFGGGRRQENNATMPYFKLPQAEREKYQNLPPTPTEAKEAEIEEQKKKGGVPGWLWISAGLGAGFLFLIAALLLAWYLLSPKTGFEVAVKSQPGSEAFVDNQKWGITQPDGTILLQNLEAGTRTITVKKSGYKDYTEAVKGENGDRKELVTRQEPNAVAPPVDDPCKGPFKPGEEAKAAACANTALDNLGDDFTLQQLLDAMNKYIVKFDVNKYDIKDQDKPFLQKAAGYMKKLAAKYPNVKIEVGGHTDSDGSDAKNQPLSENRAKAVHDMLVGFGVNPNMLEERGYGSKSPKVANDSPEHKFQNRRIEYRGVMSAS